MPIIMLMTIMPIMSYYACYEAYYGSTIITSMIMLIIMPIIK